MPFVLIRNDITLIKADAIVNAANNRLLPGGGVCGAIFKAAGKEKLQAVCEQIGYCETGEAVITSGFDSNAKYIIHTPGPVYGENPDLQDKLLYNCYRNSLILAEQKGVETIAFPLISTGIYGYPKNEALEIAVRAIRDFLEKSEMTVYLVVYDRTSYCAGRERFGEIISLIREKDVREETRRFCKSVKLPDFEKCESPLSFSCAENMESVEECSFAPSVSPKKSERSLSELLSKKPETFSQMLLRLIDQKGMSDVEVYKRANLDRKLFSKIRKKDYKPKKQTAIALAVALRLNCDETIDLLSRAGYAFSASSDFDIIIKYFIQNGIYDIYEINMTLFDFEQPTLGA